LANLRLLLYIIVRLIRE